MGRCTGLATLFVLFWTGTIGWAGIYNSAEPPISRDNDLNAFQDRLASLRSLGPSDARTLEGQTGKSDRDLYLEKIEALRKKEKTEGLNAEETANLGAYLYRVRKTQNRLPDLQEATQVLEAGRRKFPHNFWILANLGTIYQVTGATDAAESCLEEALELAPPEWQQFERYQLLLLKRRSREAKSLGTPPLDGVFFKNPREPLRFVGPSGKYEIGALAPQEVEKLPGGSLANATAIIQQLLIWLPDDGRLLWQLGEFAAVQDQPKAAARALEACVDTFRLSTPELKQHRGWLLEYVAWSEVLHRLGPRTRQFTWLGQWLPVGTWVATGQGGNSWLPEQAGLLQPVQPKSLMDQINFGSPAVTGPVFTWDLVSWPLALGGGIVILLLTALQAREWLRRWRPRSTPLKGAK